MRRTPTLFFVANDQTPKGKPIYDDLRYALYTAREICGWDHRVVVLDVGLEAGQAEALRQWGAMVLGAPPWDIGPKFMWKAWADKLLTASDNDVDVCDPLIVADVDLEFRDKDVLDELVELGRREKVFIVEEPVNWAFNACGYWGADANAEVATYVDAEFPDGALRCHNAGLFGGGRPWIDRLLSLVRCSVPGLRRRKYWFWEQLALSRFTSDWMLRDHAVILKPEYNWLTCFGWRDAKVVHFQGGRLQDRRTPIPHLYLWSAGPPPRPAPTCIGNGDPPAGAGAESTPRGSGALAVRV